MSQEDQPFFVVENESYDRMMNRLQIGERYVKSYSSAINCPHGKSDHCDCPFSINFLIGEDMVRADKGEIKPVFRESMLDVLEMDVEESKQRVQQLENTGWEVKTVLLPCGRIGILERLKLQVIVHMYYCLCA